MFFETIRSLLRRRSLTSTLTSPLPNPLPNFVVLGLVFSLGLPTPSSYAQSYFVMGPLQMPNSRSAGYDSTWEQFEYELRRVKTIGVQAVTLDVWWGFIEPEENRFDWNYYDRAISIIERVGLKWVPILSFHQCGGNVNDACNIPLPQWIWSKYREFGLNNERDLQFQSEQGRVSREYISFWNTHKAIPLYRRVMNAFREQYRSKAHLIAEINISLGPSGELRYPSYNSHDIGTGYPHRGGLQAYSAPARESFRNFVQNKYGSVEAIERAWNFRVQRMENITPPSPDTVERFFASNEHYRPYGQDFFDWYHGSLSQHGETLLRLASEAFHQDRAFSEVPLGAKIPGVHWRTASDRLAELTSGLLTTREPILSQELRARGYAPLLSMFERVKNNVRNNQFILHFTCLEKDNWEDGWQPQSLAKDLVFWIGFEARDRGITIKGENALPGPIQSDRGWWNMKDALKWGNYGGLTILRLQALARSDFALNQYRWLMQETRQRPAPDRRTWWAEQLNFLSFDNLQSSFEAR